MTMKGVTFIGIAATIFAVLGWIPVPACSVDSENQVPAEDRRHLQEALGAPFVVFRDKVQDDLKLSDEQKKTLDRELWARVQDAMRLLYPVAPGSRIVVEAPPLGAMVDALLENGGPKTADFVIAIRDGTGFKRDHKSAAILKHVNTEALEYAADISADGLELFFTRVNFPLTTPPAIFRAARVQVVLQ
jgi:hypothetical protein